MFSACRFTSTNCSPRAKILFGLNDAYVTNKTNSTNKSPHNWLFVLNQLKSYQESTWTPLQHTDYKALTLTCRLARFFWLLKATSAAVAASNQMPLISNGLNNVLKHPNLLFEFLFLLLKESTHTGKLYLQNFIMLQTMTSRYIDTQLLLCVYVHLWVFVCV